MEHRRPIAIDLFAGAGGLSLGFEQAGFDVVAAVEFDPVHAAVHEYNFPLCNVICSDINDVNGTILRDKAEIGDRDIDVVIGGPPCQGFSMIGKRILSDPRNDLIEQFIRIVGELRPKYFVMENVAGLTVGDHGKILENAINAFNEMGYDTNEPRILQAMEYGVPQSRRRLFLIGAREGLDVPEYPQPITTGRSFTGELENEKLPPCPSVEDAIGDLPDVDEFESLVKRDWVRTKRFGEPSKYARAMREMEDSEEIHSRPRTYDPNVLTSSMRTKHTKASIDRFKKTNPGETEKVSRFKKLHPDGVSNTLRAGTASDHGAYTAPRPIHPKYPRVITVREAARLHGYPDWFRFHATKWNGFREVGNSVPPPLAKAVGSSIFDKLGARHETEEPIELGNPELLYFTQQEAERYYGIKERVIPQRTRKKDDQ